MGSFIRIGLGIEEGESSLCGGAPRAVIPDGILKCPDPACTHPKTYLWGSLVFPYILVVQLEAFTGT